VQSYFPESRKAKKGQKTRWVQGYLMVMKTHVPRLLFAAFERKDIKLLIAALDLAVPPLSLYLLTLMITILISLLAANLHHSGWYIVVPMTGFCAFAAAIAVAWSNVGRDVIGLKELMELPVYVWEVIRSSSKLLLRPKPSWTKTMRN
jgi:hypothetical protein